MFMERGTIARYKAIKIGFAYGRTINNNLEKVHLS